MAGNKRQCHVAFDERPRVSGGYAQSINRADSMPHEDAIKSYHETGGNAATASLPFCNRPVRECSVNGMVLATHPYLFPDSVRNRLAVALSWLWI
jgi:hypothetical protein